MAKPQDPELLAMMAIQKHMEELDNATRSRVVGWVNDRYSVEVPSTGNEFS